LYVIHYTDKNVTSNVDSITVTKRVDRYDQIIREMLNTQMARYENFPKPNAESQAQIISAFNLLNGVWLLRILNTHQNNRNIVREKLSIISAYKLVIGILNTKNTLWVPISLEELLRITGGSGLSKQNSMLSGEQLSKLRSASDDILMMGAELAEDGTVKMHILPVEVKVGENAASVLAKAKSQVTSTIHFLNDAVLKAESFTGRVFRDFFMTLYLNNLSKMESSGVFKDKDYSVLESIKYQLKGEKAVFTNDAGYKFGNGLIVSFKQDAIYRNFEALSTDDGYDIGRL
jgi:DNA phosphorothioation-dependent restriction protein DptH